MIEKLIITTIESYFNDRKAFITLPHVYQIESWLKQVFHVCWYLAVMNNRYILDDDDNVNSVDESSDASGVILLYGVDSEVGRFDEISASFDSTFLSVA